MSAPRAAKDIRETFLRFFEGKGHARVASASLVPSDPTLLFTNAGMVPFKRVFTGEETRPYKRATTTQKCMRVSGKHNDLEEVGRSLRHNTFFEMLGNFSFGDYFKQDAIAWAWQLVTEGFGIPADRLGVTVFREDDEAARIWREELGVAEGRIVRLDEADNFWQMGDTGPCGPCSEIYFDTEPRGGEGFDPTEESGRWLEIWNLVFMQFDRSANGVMTALPRPCVDTGAGLERVAAVLQGATWVYDTDLFHGILLRAQEISGVARGADPEKDVSLNVIADHARALAFLIGDGVLPSNEGRGYVLRRILRRAARHGALLGIEKPFLHRVADAVIDAMAGAYPELSERRAFITGRIEREEGRFLETLSKGLALLEEEVAKLRREGGTRLPGAAAFRLYDTFGFPVDLTEDVLRGHGLSVDQDGFASAMGAQRERARAAWKGSGEARVGDVHARLAAELSTAFHGYETLRFASTVRALLVGGELRDSARAGDLVEVVVDETPFYAESGGQVGDRGEIGAAGGVVRVGDAQRPAGDLVVHRGRVASGEIRVGDAVELRVDAEARAATVRNHSGTHLLHAALRRVLGPQALQKGSLVAPDRLRFDFTHDSPLSPEQIRAIEDQSNAWIEADATAEVRELPYAEAIASGAVAIFEEKYGEQVRVISFGDFSTELCGGTHARATGEIGLLKILAESGIAAGVRRIEAQTGLGALAFLRAREDLLERAAALLRVPAAELPERLERLLEERRALERELGGLRAAARGAVSRDLTKAAREVAGVRVLSARVDGTDAKSLRGMVDELRSRLGSAIVLLAAEEGGKVSLALGVTPDLVARFPAGDLVREISQVVGGKGGGRPDFAQGGGSDPSRLDDAFRRLDALVGGA